MKLEKSKVWDIPAGKYQAFVESARLFKADNGDSNEDYIRVIYTITSEKRPLEQYQARAVYKAKDLRKFVKEFQPIVGDEIINRLFNDQGELLSENLSLLTKTPVDIEITHHLGRGFEKPLCQIAKVKKLGELIQLDEAA